MIHQIKFARHGITIVSRIFCTFAENYITNQNDEGFSNDVHDSTFSRMYCCNRD